MILWQFWQNNNIIWCHASLCKIDLGKLNVKWSEIPFEMTLEIVHDTSDKKQSYQDIFCCRPIYHRNPLKGRQLGIGRNHGEASGYAKEMLLLDELKNIPQQKMAEQKGKDFYEQL